jgi:DNA-binding Lrp family transcriptional regulator
MRKDILELLQENNKLTPEQIGTMLELSVEDVKREIKEMEDKKIIVKYSTVINWEKAEVESVSALIDVKVLPERGVGFDTIAERIYRYPEVQSVYLISGAYDLAVIVEGKTLKEVAQFVAEKLATLEHVQSTSTNFILKRYKQNGIILDDKEESKRLVISP